MFNQRTKKKTKVEESFTKVINLLLIINRYSILHITITRNFQYPIFHSTKISHYHSFSAQTLFCVLLLLWRKTEEKFIIIFFYELPPPHYIENFEIILLKFKLQFNFININRKFLLFGSSEYFKTIERKFLFFYNFLSFVENKHF